MLCVVRVVYDWFVINYDFNVVALELFTFLKQKICFYIIFTMCVYILGYHAHNSSPPIGAPCAVIVLHSHNVIQNQVAFSWTCTNLLSILAVLTNVRVSQKETANGCDVTLWLELFTLLKLKICFYILFSWYVYILGYHAHNSWRKLLGVPFRWCPAVQSCQRSFTTYYLASMSFSS